MKGIVLAGGAGTRLDPITRVASKQLQPVYDKPMIYYPLSTLLEGGIREILVISTPTDIARFESLLGDGTQWGASISYAIQAKPEGIAQALVIGADYIGDDAVALILGDNIFHGLTDFETLVTGFQGGALIFGYPVGEPQRYGVVELDDTGGVVSIEEKPAAPRSNLAIPGLYLYDRHVVEVVRGLSPSPRGELEITDVNLAYLAQGGLQVVPLGRGVAWLDSGTNDSLLEAANFVATIERRQGLKIACLEEIALRRGYVSDAEMRVQVNAMPDSGYRHYLEQVLGST